MEFFSLFFLLLVWLIISVVVGFVANSRGRSGIGFFLLSFLLSPILTLIILLLIRNYAEENRQWHQKNNLKQSSSFARNSMSENRTEDVDLVKIERLAALWKSGALSDEEFQVQKSKIFDLSEKKSLDNQHLIDVKSSTRKVTQIYGICPSCRSTIEIESISCCHCGSSSSSVPNWQPQSM